MRHKRNNMYSMRIMLSHLEQLRPAECLCQGGESLECEVPCNEWKKMQFMKRWRKLLRHLVTREKAAILPSVSD